MKEKEFKNKIDKLEKKINSLDNHYGISRGRRRDLISTWALIIVSLVLTGIGILFVILSILASGRFNTFSILFLFATLLAFISAINLIYFYLIKKRS